MKRILVPLIPFFTLFLLPSFTFATQTDSHFSDGTQKFRFSGEFSEVTFKAPSNWYVETTSLDDCEMYTFYPLGEDDQSLFYGLSIWDGYRMTELSNDELLENFKSVPHEISALDNGKRIAIAEYDTDDGKFRVDLLIPEDTCYIVVLYGSDYKIPDEYQDAFESITETINSEPK